ncbi:MAG: ABC transporter ATP-binding protein [Dehalococcoidia bacterium]
MTRPSDTPVVRVENVSRHFEVGGQTIHALKDVSFQVDQGEFVAIIGRSGSGKTTLLNSLAGLDKPSSGHVYIEEQDVSAMTDTQLTELRRHRIGFVFQSFGLLPLLSAYENIEIALRIAGAGVRERSSRARDLLELVGLTRRSHHRPYEMSGGEQQRVAIARALANRPSLILADEPTGELDSTTAASIFQLLQDVIATYGVTIITTTHDRVVMEKVDRVIELADGALVTGESSYDRDRMQSISVPIPAPEPVLPRPALDPEEREQWSRAARRPASGIYQPPGPPNEPL